MSAMFGSFDELWAAMNRLYVQQVKHDEQIAQLRETQAKTGEQMQATDARLDRLASMIATLAGTVAEQTRQVESHERRLERMEGQ